MANFKNIRIKMKGGKSRMQRVKVLASGKYKFVKNTSTKRTSRTRKARPSRRTGVRRMTRRKKRRSGGKSIANTAMKWIRIGALVAPAVSRVFEPIAPKEKVERVIQDYTGYNINDREFRFEYLARGWAPYLGAVLTTYGIPKLASIIRRL